MARFRSARLVGLVATAALGLAVTGCVTGTSRAGPAATTFAPRTARSSAARPSSGCHDHSPVDAAGAQTLVVGTQTRSYQLTLPGSAGSGLSTASGTTATAEGSARPAPLVLLFHGYGGSGEGIDQYTDLPAQAAARGYLVASPDGSVDPKVGGTTKSWQLDAQGTDAAFVSALVAHLEATRCVDEARLYLAGFSAGAAFTLLYTCHHEGQVAAMATVAVDFQLGCTRPISLIAFHGTLDPAVPFANGVKGASLPDVAVRGTELNMGDWARLDHCSPTSTDTVLGTQVTRQIWPGCTHGTAVVLYRVEGGGHSWPGALTDDGGGMTTRQIQANQLMLDFFAHHPG